MVDYFIFLKVRCDNDNFSITKYKLSRTSSCHFHDKFYSKFEFFCSKWMKLNSIFCLFLKLEYAAIFLKKITNNIQIIWNFTKNQVIINVFMQTRVVLFAELYSFLYHNMNICMFITDVIENEYQYVYYRSHKWDIFVCSVSLYCIKDTR